jgi:hypothetical protein
MLPKTSKVPVLQHVSWSEALTGFGVAAWPRGVQELGGARSVEQVPKVMDWESSSMCNDMDEDGFGR